MALTLVNGSPAIDWLLVEPRHGAWHADVHVDQLAPLSGKVTIAVNDGALVLNGTVGAQTGEFLDTARARVVGGAGGMSLTARPRRYRSATVGLILADLARDAGEALDPSSDAAVTGAAVPDWTTAARPVGAELGRLLAAAAPLAVWRITLPGLLRVGVDAWPDAALADGTFQLVDDAPEDTRATVQLDAPAPLAGTTFLGRRVSMAQTRMPPDGAVEADVWFEAELAPPPLNRLAAALFAIIQAAPPGLDSRLRFWAKVVQQGGGRIHVAPEDGGMPDMGEVDLALPPGESWDGVHGGRVLVGWSGRDRAAYAEGFQGATPAARKLLVDTLLTLGAEAGAEPPVKQLTATADLAEFFAALTTWLTTTAAPILEPAGPPYPQTAVLVTEIGKLVAAMAKWGALHTVVG